MKFQVGDLIKGLPSNGYNITNHNMYIEMEKKELLIKQKIK